MAYRPNPTCFLLNYKDVFIVLKGNLKKKMMMMMMKRRRKRTEWGGGKEDYVTETICDL